MSRKNLQSANAPVNKNGKESAPGKESFWKSPNAAPLITAILGGLVGIAALLNALLPYVSPFITNPTAPPVPPTLTAALPTITVIPPTITAIPSTPTTLPPTPTSFDLCLLYYMQPTLYEIPIGRPKNITPAESTFALKFMDGAKHIGGMKLEYIPTKAVFGVFSRAGEDCIDIDPSGRQEDYPYRAENDVVFQGIHYLLILDEKDGVVRVEIRQK